jgi:hypothetical protein
MVTFVAESVSVVPEESSPQTAFGLGRRWIAYASALSGRGDRLKLLAGVA